jgi:hypothetical protein
MDNTKVLPPETIQKEFERNPLKLLEELRLEENSNQNFEDEKNQPEINREPMINPQENDDINITNLNCKNFLINCNPYINSQDSNNFFVNNFNIFPNFQGKTESTSNENNFVNINVDNPHCEKNDIYIKQNSNFDKQCNHNKIENSIKTNYNKNVNNNKPINISKLLSNLKTYKGSIYAQSLLECIETEQELSSFFNDIIPNICQIMCSEYGNYFFQKLLKKLSLNQRLQIYKIIQPEFLVIATNKWGTHSIQSLMENAQSQVEIYQLNLLMSKNMYLLFTDDNAYHIMMKMILDFPEDQRIVLNLYMATNIDKIITNNNGAFCVNKFITNNKDLKLRKLFLDNLKINLRKLIFNKFCCINLLIILQTFGLEWGSFIIKEIQENFIALLDNSVSRLFVIKVFEYLKSINLYFLKELLWSLYRNKDVINYISANKGKKKLLNQLIELSDDEQKVYLYILLKRSNW